MGIRILVHTGIAAVLATTFAACGGGGSSPTSPAGDDGPIAATIVIDATGTVSPKDVTVPVGSRVTFTNNHNTNHEMASDPHPEHTDCPEFDQVGFLSPGQARETGNLVTARTCGFHDHDNPDNAGLKGSVTIR